MGFTARVAVGTEDAHDLDLKRMLAVAIEKQGFSSALAFAITTANTHRIEPTQ